MLVARAKNAVAWLGCVIFICALFIVPAHAQVQSGSVNVAGVVPGPPPAAPPTIDSPVDGSTLVQKNNEINGGCITDLTVKIFRNGVFAGSAPCQDSRYSLAIDLVDARNDLIARQYDSLDQASPDSDTITVFYQAPAEAPPLPSSPSVSGEPAQSVASFQLIIDYDYNFEGITPNVPVHLPIHFAGGVAPYAISAAWGDGNVSLLSRTNSEQFFVDHTYTKPGVYTVKVRISDSNGTAAFLQFVLRVNGVSTQTTFFGTPVVDAFGKSVLPAFTVPTISFGVVAFTFGLAMSRLGPAILKAILRLFLIKK